MNNLAGGYKNAGQFDKALPLYEQTVKLLKANLGPDHPATLSCRSNLAAAYRAAGQFDKAQPLYEQAVEFMKANLGPNHPETLNGLRKLSDLLAQYGSFLVQSGAYEEAEVRLRKCLTIRQLLVDQSIEIRSEQLGVAPWQVASAGMLLGSALLGQKKFNEAEHLLVAGYEGMKQDLGAMPLQAKSDIYFALDQLIELAKATNNSDDLQKWQIEKERFVASQEQPDHDHE
jgi:tetratricopeptide (TPR) repeat protein